MLSCPKIFFLAAAFMRMVTAALSRGDPPGNELLDDGINLPLDPEIHLDIVGAEEIYRFRTHPADDYVRYLVLGEQRRQPPRLMARVWQVQPLGYLPVLYAEEDVFLTVPEMTGDLVPVLCNSDFHKHTSPVRHSLTVAPAAAEPPSPSTTPGYAPASMTIHL
jgi:hypothetical protein